MGVALPAAGDCRAPVHAQSIAKKRRAQRQIEGPTTRLVISSITSVDISSIFHGGIADRSRSDAGGGQGDVFRSLRLAAGCACVCGGAFACKLRPRDSHSDRHGETEGRSVLLKRVVMRDCRYSKRLSASVIHRCDRRNHQPCRSTSPTRYRLRHCIGAEAKSLRSRPYGLFLYALLVFLEALLTRLEERVAD